MRLPAACLALTLAIALHAETPAAYTANPKFQKEVAAAKEPRDLTTFRIDHWKKANKIAGGACEDCLLRIAELEYRSGDTKGTLQTTTELETHTTSPQVKAVAEYLRGSTLLYANQGRPKPEQLQAATADFRAAAKNDPSLHMALFREGSALALEHQDDDARQAFSRFVELTPETDRFRIRARHFAENPALAREKMAPPFAVTTADGKQFTLDDMGGRVVLVDFWATWCGPCNQELPHIAKLAQEFAGQPFVLISVSWDKDPAKWHDFIASHGMTWNQYRDDDHQLSTAYGVDAIPHYFTIDSDGVLQDEKIGSGSNIEGKLKKLVARAREAQKPAPPTAASTDTGPAANRGAPHLASEMWVRRKAKSAPAFHPDIHASSNAGDVRAQAGDNRSIPRSCPRTAVMKEPPA